MTDIAYIALGANLGAAQQNLLRAIDALQALAAGQLIKSGLWLSEPVDCPDGSEDFINAVVGLEPKPHSSPDVLLRQLKRLELDFGRRLELRGNSPRPLDLDIIAYGDLTVRSAHLVIPHPRFQQRLFVLKPLQEIAPHLVLPGFTRTVTELVETAAPMRIARLKQPACGAEI
jgi:2-amino-4-hydroxy-6-hydroxymethyldihydropteridine diphosphokinase